MIDLELTRAQGKVRVWLGELPPCNFCSEEGIERTLPSVRLETQRQQCVAVELFVHTGPRFLYGLLAAEFVPEDSRVLLLQVLVSSAGERRYDAALAAGMDEVRIGLPPEYAEGVLEGAAAAASARVLGSGVLRFSCAAHGEVGSSVNHFRRLATVAVQLLCLEGGAASEDEVVGLIESQIVRRSPN